MNGFCRMDHQPFGRKSMFRKNAVQRGQQAGTSKCGGSGRLTQNLCPFGATASCAGTRDNLCVITGMCSSLIISSGH